MRSQVLAVSLFCTITCFIAPAAAPAQSRHGAARPSILPDTEERTLALEALPAVLRSGAGVWILTPSGYREAQRSNNGWTCIVNRDEVEAIKPTCYDEEGTASILPVDIFFGEQLMKGVPVADITAQVAEGYRSGRFHSPRRLGIAFMLSPNIVNVRRQPDGRVAKSTAPPHYMIYAPHATNAQLQLPDTAYAVHPWLPYIAYAGPAGFLIISIPDSAVSNAQHHSKATHP